jgi:hypothetical protein
MEERHARLQDQSAALSELGLNDAEAIEYVLMLSQDALSPSMADSGMSRTPNVDFSLSGHSVSVPSASDIGSSDYSSGNSLLSQSGHDGSSTNSRMQAITANGYTTENRARCSTDPTKPEDDRIDEDLRLALELSLAEVHTRICEVEPPSGR